MRSTEVANPLALGIDVGTSGVRTVAVDRSFATVAIAKSAMDSSKGSLDNPSTWLSALDQALNDLKNSIDVKSIKAVCIDGTSGTVLGIDESNNPVGSALMYDYAVPKSEIIDRIASVAPSDSAAHGSSSALAKSILVSKRPGVVRIAHQADWIAENLCGESVPSDESNSLKTGYDPVNREWSEWIPQTGMKTEMLPDVVPTGTPISKTASKFGLPSGIPVIAGLTDGCASFFATGASGYGDGVTALGTSMTLKIMSEQPVFSPEFGIYSHRINELWLAGGASNCGGGALAAQFSQDEIENLSKEIDTGKLSGLDYYPLARKGERFPINDPDLEPRIDPKPKRKVDFLHGLMEGIANIERLGYSQLEKLGCPKLKTIRTVGGGAKNNAFGRIRIRILGVPNASVDSDEAAVGSARIAWKYLEAEI